SGWKTGGKNIQLRIDSRQAARSRAPHQPQQNSFRLVVECVGSRNPIHAILVQQSMEVAITQFSARRFQTHLFTLRMRFYRSPLSVEFQLVLQSEGLYELLVTIGLFPAKLMIQVNDGENDAQLFAQLQEQPQQRHRIRAAGYSNTDAVAGLNQFLTKNIGQKLLSERRHLHMVLRRAWRSVQQPIHLRER